MAKVKKVGRPKVKHQRKHVINVRLNALELKEVERYMKKHGMTAKSSFFRKVVMAKVMQKELFDKIQD